MSDLNGQEGELRFTVTVKRALTGKEDVYEMVGKLTEEQLEEVKQIKES